MAGDDFRKAARTGLDVVVGLGDTLNRTFQVKETYSGYQKTVDLTKGATVQLFSIQQFQRFMTCVTWQQALSLPTCTPQEKERISLLGYSYQLIHPHHYEWLPAKKEWEPKDVWLDRTLGPTGVEVIKAFDSAADLNAYVAEAITHRLTHHCYVDQHGDLHLIEGAETPSQ